VRKDNPVAALFHGLGPERACALPGWAGDALLASSEVRAGFPAVESVLSLPEAGRQQVLQRMSDWPDVGSDAAEILDGALRVWRETAAAGLGLVSFRISV
jgi:hypothetical protein